MITDLYPVIAWEIHYGDSLWTVRPLLPGRQPLAAEDDDADVFIVMPDGHLYGMNSGFADDLDRAKRLMLAIVQRKWDEREAASTAAELRA